MPRSNSDEGAWREIRIVLGALVAMLAIVLVPGCVLFVAETTCGRGAGPKIVSPDGRFVAQANDAHCRLKFEYRGQVTLADRTKPRSRQAVYAFEGSWDSVTLTWRDARHLEIGFQDCRELQGLVGSWPEVTMSCVDDRP